MANETTKLTAKRGLLYDGVMIERGAEFEVRSQDVEQLTAGPRPMAVGGKTKSTKSTATKDEAPTPKDEETVTVDRSADDDAAPKAVKKAARKSGAKKAKK